MGHFVYTKYKSQYPHSYALKSVGNHLLNAENKNDVIKLINIMLEYFECGIIKNEIADTFQIFFGKTLISESIDLLQYIDKHCICAKLYTYSGNLKSYLQVIDRIYISPKQLSKFKQSVTSKLKKELLALFFHRSPSGILESEIAYVYRQKYKCTLYLINISLSDFIRDSMKEYIECCQTQQRRTLYHFRSSYMGINHTITKLLRSIDLTTRCELIKDKMSAILSLYSQGIEWSCLVKAVLCFGSFQINQWLFTTEQSPPSCLQLLQTIMPNLHVQTLHNVKICILKKFDAENTKRKTKIYPATDIKDICSYYDLIINLLKNESDKNKQEEDNGLFDEQIERIFNVKYAGFRLIIETPLIFNNIRSRINAEIFEEYKRFKYNQPTPQIIESVPDVIIQKKEEKQSNDDEIIYS